MQRMGLATLALLTSLTFFGCDQSPRRQSISGTVTLDGKPLPYGTILFDPEVRGPKAAASIRAGIYRIEPTRGPLSGPTIVVIHSPKFPQDLELPDDTGELAVLADQYPEALPARYNAKSELRADVTEDGPNEFNFELQSDR